MTQLAHKAKKGDAVAIEVKHSYQSLKDGYVPYTRWHLATVTRSSKEGEVREVQMAGSFHSLRAAMVGKVFTISGDMQAPARAAIEATKSPTNNDYETADDLRAAVRAHAKVTA